MVKLPLALHQITLINVATSGDLVRDDLKRNRHSATAHSREWLQAVAFFLGRDKMGRCSIVFGREAYGVTH